MWPMPISMATWFPSSISVVATDQMIEVKRIRTCTMPHGSRLNHAGTKHYSVCMMDDMLVEIDTSKFAVDRYFMLAQGKEMGMTGAPFPQFQQSMGDHKMADHQHDRPQTRHAHPRGPSPPMTGRSFMWPAINRARLLPSTPTPGLWRAGSPPVRACTTWP